LLFCLVGVVCLLVFWLCLFVGCLFWLSSS
jgi:hypothetical protein